VTQLLIYLTLLVTAAVVVALVVYLLGIIFALWGTLNYLRQLAAGLTAIRDNTQPLEGHVRVVNEGLVALLQHLLTTNGNLAAIVRLAGEAGPRQERP